MRQKLGIRSRFVGIPALILILGTPFLGGCGTGNQPKAAAPGAVSVPGVHPPATQERKNLRSDEISAADLPAEARQTLLLIRKGGPFPYSRDGIVFNNREGLLPARPRGYYHEYTVKTPGAQDRGARRIIAGNEGEYYYTDDHYQTFKRIRE